jgi:hypothetical protein
MIGLNLLEIEEANTDHLILQENAQVSFDLSQSLTNATDGSRFRIEPKPSSSLPVQVIFIKTLTGKLLTINGCLPTDAITTIQTCIQMLEGIPYDQ